MGVAQGLQFLSFVPLTFTLFFNYITQLSQGFKAPGELFFREQLETEVLSFLSATD